MEKEIVIPSVGESITEVTISTWLKQDGDYVEMDDILCEIDSDKASFELNAEDAGVLKILKQEGETVQIGDKVATIDTSAAKQGGGGDKKEETKSDEDNKPSETKSSPEKESTYASGHPSPAAAKIFEEKGISPSDVKGTGKDGRITKEDAEKAQASKKETSQPSQPKPAAQPAQPAGERGSAREKVTTLRKTIARRLVEVKNQTAMLTTFNEVDMSGIMELRKKYKDTFKDRHQVGLGFMSFFTKAVTIALQEFPSVNAYFLGDEVEYHNYCDVGIAVSTPRGLVVPVIRNAETLSLHNIEKAIGDVAIRARDNKISIDEMQGGTFTITNGGVFGSMLSTPILNPPQSAILGMHNIVERAVVINGEVKVRPIMYVALSYDHRIIDGKESVSFLVRVKQLLEDPARMLLEV